MIPKQENLQDAFKAIYEEKIPIITDGNLHGLERECLRVDLNAKISTKPHPDFLGASFTHPSITTDFSESQIEFTTQPHPTIHESLQELESLQHFVCTSIKKEFLWPMSMPAWLPENEKQIPLAKFGISKEGQKKNTYRRGLGNRYGRRMQTISGIHYNYSFGKPLLDYIHAFLSDRGLPVKKRSEFKTQIYFHTIRNFFRNSFFIPYLFGASNAIDESFFYGHGIDPRLKKSGKRTWINSMATSLRMSGIGYTNPNQNKIDISYDTLKSYLDGLQIATTTHCSDYENFSIKDKQQLNSNLLQIENEYYSILRPKPDLNGYDSSIDALRDRGVFYIEIRGLDLSPSLPFAVDENRMAFIHMLLLDCLFNPSPPLLRQEQDQIEHLFREVVWNGRQKGTPAQSKIKEEGLKLLERLAPIAELIDLENKNELYKNTLKNLEAVIVDPLMCPTYQLMSQIYEGKDMIELGLELSNKHCSYLAQNKLTPQMRSYFEKIAKDSLLKQKEIEQNEKRHIL